ncbi:hypothetical protein GCM10022215_24260 [Nocardioides fonticola]|uniref:Phage portal protein n=1 Tax=Nocardioides fonticola TaxID=450363 RepID=A0ABP7XJS8_9ACTN
MPTELEWIQYLEEQIERQEKYAKAFECRYRNEYVLPFIAAEYRDVYGARVDGLMDAMISAPRAGAAAITVDALVERLGLEGATSDDPKTLTALTAAWDDNALDVMHRMANHEAVLRGRSFGVVSRATDGARGIFTIESSAQAAVHRMQAPPYDVDAYFKRWTDEWTGKMQGLLRLPGRDIPVREGRTEIGPGEGGQSAAGRWELLETVDTKVSYVQVVEFPHHPQLLRDPMSEIEPITTLVDQVDLIEGLMVFAGHFGAVPIRYGTGVDVLRDPKDPTKPLLGPDGRPLMGFKPRADHFWFTTDKDGRFGQLTPATLDTFIAWANHARSNLRAKTKVTSSDYAIDLKTHMSSELLKVDEAPMVRRINRIGRKGSLNHAWGRGLQMLVELEGHKGRVRPVWEDPNTRLEAQAVDAFNKAVNGGIGVVTAAERFLGWPREVAEAAWQEHLKELAAADAAAQTTDPFSLLDPATRAALKLVPSSGTTLPAAGA